MSSSDAKIIPISRISAVWGTSKRFTQKVLKEAEDKGLIDPARTPSGREFLSVKEWEIVSEMATASGGGK